MQCDLQLLHSLFQESVYIEYGFSVFQSSGLAISNTAVPSSAILPSATTAPFYLQSKFLHLTESRISFQFLLSQAYPQFLFINDNH